MLAVAEDLRHRGPAAGPADRFLALRRALRGVDLTKRHPAVLQQTQRAGAVGAIRLGVDFDHGHRILLLPGKSSLRSGFARGRYRRRGSGTLAATSTSTPAAPAASRARAQALAVAPEVIRSSISSTRAPAIRTARAGR